MPVTTIQRMQCNVCRLEAERELFDKLPPPKGWFVFKTKSGEDHREKIEVAVCPDCAHKISALVVAIEQETMVPKAAESSVST